MFITIMRALIQRVLEAKLVIQEEIHEKIQHGLVVFLGVEEQDTEEDINWLASKLMQIRLFNDDHAKMNFNITEVAGSLMIISQFTLFASTKKGNRPGFTRAAQGNLAEQKYEQFLQKLHEANLCKVTSGIFGADMKIHLINDGPVTIWIDTKNKE